MPIGIRPRGRSQGRNEQTGAPDKPGLQAVTVSGYLRGPDANQILKGKVSSDETVRFRQAPRPRDVEEKMDPRCRVNNLGPPWNAERLEQFDGSTRGEGKYSGRGADAQRWQIAGRRPGAEVTNRHARRGRHVVFVAHGCRHRPDRLVASTVSCAHLE